MPLVRLQKYLSECGVASRRRAEELIAGGKIKVNGRVVSVLGSKVDPQRDEVQVENRKLRLEPKGVILLNKPEHVVSTMSDPEGRRTVADYMTSHFRSYFPVGRLDYDSCGLVIMTNDGALAEFLLHPRYGFDRVYHVTVAGRVAAGVLDRIEHGVKLSDGWVRAKADLLERGDEKSLLEISINEGRNRVIRRMMDKLGFEVKKLKRVSHGPFRLGTLKPGHIKKLTEREYASFRDRVVRRAGR